MPDLGHFISLDVMTSVFILAAGFCPKNNCFARVGGEGAAVPQPPWLVCLWLETGTENSVISTLFSATNP